MLDPPSNPLLAAWSRLTHAWSRRVQTYLDASVPHLAARWGVTGLLLVLYVVRVVVWPGWYIISYGLGIYLLNVLVDFVSPLEDPDALGPLASAELPMRADDEYRPFLRKLPEFASWVRATRALALGLVLTLFRFLDVPVFYPILILYFIMLFVSTLKQRVQHMLRHRYVPLSLGKPRFSK